MAATLTGLDLICEIEIEIGETQNDRREHNKLKKKKKESLQTHFANVWHRSKASQCQKSVPAVISTVVSS